MKWLVMLAVVAAVGLGVVYQEEIERSLSDGSPKMTVPVIEDAGRLKGAISKSMRGAGDLFGR